MNDSLVPVVFQSQYSIILETATFFADTQVHVNCGDDLFEYGGHDALRGFVICIC